MSGVLHVQNNDYLTSDNPNSLSADVVAGAVAFEALKRLESFLAETGPPQTYDQAKELIAGFVSATVDNFAETMGLSNASEINRLAQAKAEAAYNANKNA
ncbi:hypothetical protein B0O80DRAFT_442459 [Mortierella sp. GBAus27b]|nr:hypothetical protein BGX31_005458 [Mortierella sp. GBA43]KAI8358902.1 hypothetical protein B0O80DRAFT_442459 [Mortierella sp. GBAus27b]